MTKYRVNYLTVASTGVYVEADSEEEAIELADAEGQPGLCAQCAGWGRPGVELGDWEPDSEYPVEVVDP
jgi:hypothetical protein